MPEEAQMYAKTWSVEIFISEEDHVTRARAVLRTEFGQQVSGEGMARHNPRDPAIPEIGDEVAAARALRNLGDVLLGVSAEDISVVTRESAVLLS
jgi:hypothetical protein